MHLLLPKEQMSNQEHEKRQKFLKKNGTEGEKVVS
jgi:hypothetical protein